MPEFVIFPLHILSLVFSAYGIFMADKKAYFWFSGKQPTLDLITLKKYHHHVLIGLGLMIVTGFFLFWPARSVLLHSVPFYVKMFFVAALVVNSFFIGTLMKITVDRTYASISPEEKIPLFISGAVSGIGWAGAAVAAFFLFS